MKTENNKIISIIVPVYNVEKYLAKCIESIINQTYKNLEIFLVDDGSTDKSGLICDEYAKKDKRIKVIHGKNSGLAMARNIGIDNATGEYISFVDSDDWLDLSMYSKMISAIIKNNADIVQCDFFRTRLEKVNIPQYPINEEVLDGKSAIKKLYDVKNVFPSVLYTVVWNKLYRAELLKDIRFPKGKIFEDQFFTYKVFYRTTKIVCSNEKLYYYRERANSITKSGYITKFYDEIEAYENQIKFFKVNNEIDLKRMLVREIVPLLISHYYDTKKHINNSFWLRRKLKRKTITYSFLHFLDKNNKINYKFMLIVFILNADIYKMLNFDISKRDKNTT